MTTRSKHGISKPKIPFFLTVESSLSPIPSTYHHALMDPNWRQTMLVEFNAFIKNGTWTLFPGPMMLMLFLASGYTGPNSGPMVLLSATRLDGLLVDSPNKRVSITPRLSAPL